MATLGLTLPIAQTNAAARSPWAVVGVLCLAVLTINIDTTIVNVALPTIARELQANTSELQWIVDAYNLTFAALVLTAGSLGDRFGRRGALLGGLAVFGGFSLVGGFLQTPAQLIAVRAVMGIGAAFIFPTTLSIISNLFTDRVSRAKAIGLWGATAGMGFVIGPVAGGFLLEHFAWGSVFFAMAPVALVAIALTLAWVPTSRNEHALALDFAGLALATFAVALLVFTIIEAPEAGWQSLQTIGGFVVAAAGFVAFVLWERHIDEPMMDVSLFTNLRFTAASGAVTMAFFALGGFAFLVTQFFQMAKDYSPMQTGVRMLPVALSVGAASFIGTRLALSLGNKAVIATGLAMVSAGYLWISMSSVDTSYLTIACQMVVVGAGMGFATAPATEAIMGVVPPAKAGIGSAVNDATRELGATLGVAILGSVFSSIYRGALDADSNPGLPPTALAPARESFNAALQVAGQTGGVLGQELTASATAGFLDGFQLACLVAAGVTAAAAVFAALMLPSRPRETVD
jgi:EmrB/QacA subfamily drug resistance transporter